MAFELTIPEIVAEPRIYTVEEYLAMEELAEEKHEYDNGKLLTMAGASLNHSRITANCIGEIRQELKNKKNSACFVSSSDLKIYVTAQGRFYYPDASVVCGEPEYYQKRTDTVENPTLIVEVLSDSTEGFDRGDKFDWYSTLSSFKEYLLVSQHQKKAAVWTYVSGDVWEMRRYKNPDEPIQLKSIDCNIKLEELYIGVILL